MKEWFKKLRIEVKAIGAAILFVALVDGGIWYHDYRNENAENLFR